MSIAVVRAALITERQEVLLLQRAPDERCRPGDMDLPGGSREPDDLTLHDAVAREVAEETGIVMPPDAFSLVYSRKQDDRKKPGPPRSRFLFAAQVRGIGAVMLDPTEHVGHRLVPLAEAQNHFRHPVWGVWLGGLATTAAWQSVPA